MDKTLFNLHDLILLLSAFESLAIVAFLALNKSTKTIASFLLIGFFTIRASLSLHELILWGSTFRYWVLDLSPNIFFIFNVSYLLDAPLLYLYSQASLNKDFKLQRQHLLHLIPAVLFVGFLSLTFYSLPLASKTELIKNYTFADFNFVTAEFVAKSIRLGYMLWLVVLLKRYFAQQQPSFVMPVWVLPLIQVYAGIVAWEWLLGCIKVYHSIWGLDYYDVVEIIGLTDYYLIFALTNVAIYLMVTHMAKTEAQKRRQQSQKEPINMDYVGKLEQAMEQDKLFLNPNLSFERLAEKLDIPVKDLSATINRHYQVNFYEYINHYRIQEAKRLLEDPKQSHRSITDIFYDAGFNSKSVYNTLFKKKFNMTPSQFRKKSAASG